MYGPLCRRLWVLPGKPLSGTGGAGNTVVTGIGNFGGSGTGQGGLTGQGGGQECGAFDKPSSKLPPTF